VIGTVAAAHGYVSRHSFPWSGSSLLRRATAPATAVVGARRLPAGGARRAGAGCRAQRARGETWVDQKSDEVPDCSRSLPLRPRIQALDGKVGIDVTRLSTSEMTRSPYSSQEQPRAAAPMATLRSRSSASAAIASARERASPARVTRPSLPLEISSPAPTWSLTIGGRPEAIASSVTSPNASSIGREDEEISVPHCLLNAFGEAGAVVLDVVGHALEDHRGL
jgi:hypothetical protein